MRGSGREGVGGGGKGWGGEGLLLFIVDLIDWGQKWERETEKGSDNEG